MKQCFSRDILWGSAKLGLLKGYHFFHTELNSGPKILLYLSPGKMKCVIQQQKQVINTNNETDTCLVSVYYFKKHIYLCQCMVMIKKQKLSWVATNIKWYQNSSFKMKHHTSLSSGFFIEVLLMKPLKKVATVNPDSGRTWHMKYNFPVHSHATLLILLKHSFIHTYMMHIRCDYSHVWPKAHSSPAYK